MASIENSSDNRKVTAFAGGGQTNAVQIIKNHTIIETCATAYDSIKATAAIPGNEAKTVINKGKFICNFFPKEGEKWFGKAANIPLPLNPGSSLTYNCYQNEKGINRY